MSRPYSRLRIQINQGENQKKPPVFSILSARIDIFVYELLSNNSFEQNDLYPSISYLPMKFKLIRSIYLILLLQFLPSMALAQPSDPINKVVALKWMDNLGDGQFYPERFISRGELASIMVRVFRLDLRQDLNPQDIRVVDVPPQHPHYRSIQTVLKTNIMQGYRNNLFFPNQQITRAEAIAIFAQAYGVFQFPDQTVNEFLSKFPDQNSIPTWARRAIATVVAEGFLNPEQNKYLQPLQPMTRGDMALLLNAYRERNQPQPETPVVPKANFESEGAGNRE